MRRPCLPICAGAALFAALLVPDRAAAESTIKRPGDRPAYAVELEPHFLFSPFNAPDDFTSEGLGAGFRATIEVAPRGFIRSINNSVGISFGLDWLRYPYDYYWRGPCTATAPAPGGIPVCTEVGGDGGANYFFLPVTMQWNFWLARRWSVFGEPGLAPYIAHGHFEFLHPAFYAGGRFHVTDAVSLTMRLGYPAFSLGASFLL